MARLTGFLNPGAEAAGAGFQAAQAKIALGSGGFFGVGIGNGVQKAFYLPEAHTDMISAVIGEELGMIGILGVVGLFGLLGYAGLRVAQKARDRYGKLLVAGLTSLILVQATINLFAVMGLAPLTGVPLPFVSYGNSSLLVTLFAVGLILNVARGGRATAAARPVAPPALANCASSRAGVLMGPQKEPKSGSSRGEKAPRVVVAAGGTAGHVVPAMAVADELRASGAEVSFLGTRERIEAELVPAAGYEIDFLKVRGIDRRNPLRAAVAVGEAVAAVGAARRALRRRGADVVVGGGGFVAGPAGLAAALTRTPLVLTEADSHLGLANRLLAGRARRVCLAFPIEGREGEPYLVTGRPVPAAILGADRDEARRRFGIARRGPLPAGDGRQPGRALDQPGGDRGLRRGRAGGPSRVPPRLPRHPPQRPARLRGAGAAAGRCAARPSATRCFPTSPTSATSSPPATWSWPVPAARSSRSSRPAGRRSSSHTPTRRRTTRAANAAWMAEAGAAETIADDAAERARCSPGASRRCSRTQPRLAAMAAASASLARPDAARAIADEVLAAASGAPYAPMESKRRTGT